jgi:hypothetical protein
MAVQGELAEQGEAKWMHVLKIRAQHSKWRKKGSIRVRWPRVSNML